METRNRGDKSGFKILRVATGLLPAVGKRLTTGSESNPVHRCYQQRCQPLTRLTPALPYVPMSIRCAWVRSAFRFGGKEPVGPPSRNLPDIRVRLFRFWKGRPTRDVTFRY